jgi:hypothetical protein
MAGDRKDLRPRTVAQFQKTFMGDQLQNGTVQTGVLDQQTLDRLRQAYENKRASRIRFW